MEEFGNETREPHNCVVNLRRNPVRRKEKVVIGCGAGFTGDRPAAALKLLQRVKELDYLVLECLAERMLAERYRDAKSGDKGYDPRNLGLQNKREL
ncbi:propionyl-CoA carboxylase [Perilla frutescens var. hirtella]|uniref:Propionyl-CoA carboxylase n=1 Tax=Perilla frutescens var. hirtella TaxID=608512 RepID=A0AAD4JF31_PERFH|nr:propionyl-CoA carboxylase [Perilla frutescens var. hirtella]